MDDTTKHRLEFLCNEAYDALSTVHKMLDKEKRAAKGLDRKMEYTGIIGVLTRATNMLYHIEDLNAGGTGGFCSTCEDFKDAADECYTDDNGLLRCTNKHWM